MSDLTFTGDITSMLIANGIMDKDGNWLIDPTTGQPISAGSDASKLGTEDWWKQAHSSYDSDYSAALKSGMTAEQWAASDAFAKYKQNDISAYAQTTSKDRLQNDLAFYKSAMSDTSVGPTMQANYKDLSAAAQAQLDKLNDPLTPFLINQFGSTTQTEKQLIDDRNSIYGAAQSTYQSLLDFQKQQSDVVQQLTDQIALSRAYSIPTMPEKNGTFVAGGSAQAAAAPRVGIPDLLIRY